MFDDHRSSVDILLDIIFLEIDAVVDANQPSITWDNNGIGSYEYWGFKCYDKGIDFPVPEDCLETITFEFPYLADRFIRQLARLIIEAEFESFTQVESSRKRELVTLRIPYAIEGAMVNGKNLIIQLSWEGECEEA